MTRIRPRCVATSMSRGAGDIEALPQNCASAMSDFGRCTVLVLHAPNAAGLESERDLRLHVGSFF